MNTVLWKDTKHIKHLEELVKTVTYFLNNKIDLPPPKLMIIFAVADFNSKPKSAGNTVIAIQMSYVSFHVQPEKEGRTYQAKSPIPRTTTKTMIKSNLFPPASKREPGSFALALKYSFWILHLFLTILLLFQEKKKKPTITTKKKTPNN